MTGLEEIRDERIEKIKRLKKVGENPYSVFADRDIEISDFIDNFDALEKSAENKIIAGRIMSRRGHGGIAFLDLFDGTGRVQVLMRKDEVGRDRMGLFEYTVDVGDFIECEGVALTTRRGEKSLNAKRWRMLTKSLLPLPKEHFGIKDEDDKFRRRYLDILLDGDVAEMIRKKSKFWNAFRNFLLERGFTEVETPVLETIAGGAEAKPFITHHNALDMDVYLRISAGELWQKRLMVAGMPKVFEIGRIFRNEGMSNEHLQDYTQLEFYEAYRDYKYGMKLAKEMYLKMIKEVFGTTKFTIRGMEIEFDKEWDSVSLVDVIKENFGINPLEATRDEVWGALDSAGVKYKKEETGVGRGIDLLWKTVRKTIAGPSYFVDIPVFMEPLAKRSALDPRMVERFQVLIAGSEVGKGFSELNDPIDQAQRLAQQQQMRDEGDDEAQMNDTDYVEALEYGMPPTFGFGVSERFFALLMDESIRETQIFPIMRPKK